MSRALALHALATPVAPLQALWLHGRQEFVGIGSEWDVLAAECAPSSVFHRHAWAHAWLQAHGDIELEILMLRVGARAIAILPWVRWPGLLRRYVLLGGLPTETTPRSFAARWLGRDLRWGWGATTPLLVTRASDDRAAILRAALQETQRTLHADLLQVHGLDYELPADLRPLQAIVTSREPNWVAPSGGASSGRRRLSKRSKKRMAQGAAALQALPGFAWDVVPGAALTEGDVDELQALEHKSDKASARASILTSGPRNRTFLSHLLRHDPSCRVGRMRAAGGLIAWAMGMRTGNRGEGLLLAHDPAYDAHYPGLLAYLMVEEAIDGEAPLTSWSLGRGAAFWKSGRLMAAPEPRHDIALYGPSVRGRALRILHAGLAAVSRRGRRNDGERTSGDENDSPTLAYRGLRPQAAGGPSTQRTRPSAESVVGARPSLHRVAESNSNRVCPRNAVNVGIENNAS